MGGNSQHSAQPAMRTLRPTSTWYKYSVRPARNHLTIAPHPAQEQPPPSYATVMCRVAVSHPPSGSGWRVTQRSPFSKRDPLVNSGPRYARALCSSQWIRHVLNEKQRAARAVNRKFEVTVRVSRRSVGAAFLPSLCRTPACAPAPPCIARNRNIPRTTRLAPPIGLCAARLKLDVGPSISSFAKDPIKFSIS
jgi:hypothetical protein